MRKKIQLWMLLVFLMCLGFKGLEDAEAYAQSPIDSQIDPSRIENQLPAQQSQKRRPVPNEPTRTLSANPIKGADKLHFKLTGLIVQGASIYKSDKFTKIYSPYLGQEISVAQLYDIVAQINQVYFDDGYLFTQVFLPPQSIENGVVYIQIVEGYVAQIEVQGQPPEFYPMRLALKNIAQLGVLNIKDLEREMLILNDMPGLSARSVIEQAGPSMGAAIGGLKLKILFDYYKDPLTFSLDNYGSKFIGPYQFGQSGGFSNLFHYMSQTNLRFFQTTQIKELKYFNIDHIVPLNGSGTEMALSANFSRVRPGYTLLPNDINAFSRQIALSLSHPIVKSRSETLDAKLQFERNNTYTKLLGVRLYEDLYYALSLLFNYNFADSHNGIHQFNLSLRKGLNLFDVRPTGSEDLSRAEGRTDFTLYKLKYIHQSTLPHDFGLKLTISAQYANMPLLSGEEFGYGGSEMGKAYNASEITGDKGISGQIEVNYTRSLNKAIVQHYLYYDIGKVWNNDHADSDIASAASTGIGTRLNLPLGISADFTLAKPLTRSIETPFWGNSDDIQGRLSVSYKINY